MVNEIYLVENLLNGIGINEKCIYQHCYLLAKYYLQQGYEPLVVRRNIFDWAQENKFFLDSEVLNVNQIIYKAERDKRRLREDVTVRISQEDIDEIIYRFDNPKTRKVALAILCYAKAAADQYNCFELSVVSFCNWLGYEYSFMHKGYLTELQKFGYIEKIKKTNKSSFSWNRNARSKSANFKLLVKFANNGEHVLKNNDINTLYEECFG